MPYDLETNRHHFENDIFAATSGTRLVELRPGFAKTSLQVEQRHMNNVGMVHGGAIFTLAAFAFGAAAKTGGKVAVGVNTSLSFLQATRSGTLHAEATEISRSRKLSRSSRRRGVHHRLGADGDWGVRIGAEVKR
jgi:acyl-CoA thioesterase